jgi:poly(U)-specific endoribonuclease
LIQKKVMFFFFPRLFTSFEESIWNLPTVALLRSLYDNYVPAVTTAEDHTAQEQAEEDAFLNAVLDTPVMTEAYNFLNTNGGKMLFNMT